MPLLHGNLSLKLFNATDLPDIDFSILPFRKEVSDPYLKVQAFLDGEKVQTLMKSKVCEQDLNPNWDEKFHIPICHELDELKFFVKDYDLRSGDDTMCELTISADELLEADNYVMKGWFPLTMDGEEKGKIHMKLKYKPVSDIDFSDVGVPRTLFPLRKHCGVKLYQSAHTPAESPITDIPTVDGEPYEPSSYFVDAVEAMENAQKLIYIAGWSVNAEICLLRDGAEETEKLGELLKRKADEEGVRVLVMIWNELFSRDGVVELPGLMCTHDEETVNYFEDSSVEVLNAPRNYCDGTRMQGLFCSGNFTHHQKCVIVDKEIEDDERRRIVAFVGGIDLTDGRWDTPKYKLFPSLPYEHKYDFYQNLLTSEVNIGPREPWHDIHSYVEGKAAVDVLQNYAERWRKQVDEDRVECLYPIDDEDEFDLNAVSSKGINGGNWKVQFFRSISDDSVTFDSKKIKHARHTKGKLYESSIQDAYIYHIRRAKKFIYMENQYFLGSSHFWPTPDIDACNLVPIELVMRVIRAIQQGEDFRVYIVTPMFPEGVPTSSSVQEILAFQYYTKQAMYKKIAEAIEEAGSDAHPTDYLTFFCLAKRESPDDVPEELNMPDGEDEILENVRKTLRSMIYVHSKMSIFDDEYIICGSANVNQRSMDGNRDTEMCIGAFQSDFIDCDDELKGYVQQFRLALWASHCGETMDVHLQPSSLDCMIAMKEVGQANLEKYVQYEPEHNSSHLMYYPLEVRGDGEVLDHQSFPEVPDLGGLISGQQTKVIPRFITT